MVEAAILPAAAPVSTPSPVLAPGPIIEKGVAPRPALGRIAQWAAASLLAASVLFNALLAWTNGHVTPLTPSMVSVVQAAIVLAALGLGALQPIALSGRWIAMAWLLVMAALLTSAIRAQLEPKIIGDILLIPAFILLGARVEGPVLRRTVIMLQALIVTVGLWELLRPEQFGAFFRVQDYYVNTRGFKAEDFWAGGDLFVSSERAHGRMLLDGFGFHRGSSLFLEPVSLGNWAVVTAIFTGAMWGALGRLARTFMIASVAALLVICDGRLALTVILLFCLWLPLCRFIPDRLAAFYLPGLLVLLMLGGMLGLLGGPGDNFAGRLTFGMQALGDMKLDRMLGVAENPIMLDDAGWADFVQSQSLVVALGLWLFLGLTRFGDAPGQRIAKHGVLLFITLCLPVSNSLLSIKTAALMWMIYGFYYARRRAGEGRGALSS